MAGDPVGSGFVASLAHPGGNITGLSLQTTDTATKRFELLREVVPGVRQLAVMAMSIILLPCLRSMRSRWRPTR